MHYNAPSRKVGRRFVVDLLEDLCGVQDRRWNSERFNAFQTVILQLARQVTTPQAIRRSIRKRLDAWEAGCHGMLVEETLCMCAQYLTEAHRDESEEHRAKTYHSVVL